MGDTDSSETWVMVQRHGLWFRQPFQFDHACKAILKISQIQYELMENSANTQNQTDRQTNSKTTLNVYVDKK